MKGFVIYVNNSSESKKSAKHTQSMFGDIDVSLFKGVDKTNVWQTFIDSKLSILDIKHFGGGKVDSEIATFFSHYNLWKKCIELNESILILEHDATINYKINFDVLKNFKGDLLNLGEPNWGSITLGSHPSPWKDKPSGVFLREKCDKNHYIYKMWTKKNGMCHCDTMWLFGAHGYLLNPIGAKKLVEGTSKGILPADIYIRQEIIDIYDYLPHPIKQSGNITLIQRNETN